MKIYRCIAAIATLTALGTACDLPEEPEAQYSGTVVTGSGAPVDSVEVSLASADSLIAAGVTPRLTGTLVSRADGFFRMILTLHGAGIDMCARRDSLSFAFDFTDLKGRYQPTRVQFLFCHEGQSVGFIQNLVVEVE